MKRTILIGDVHGCVDELLDLLGQVQHDPYDLDREERLIFLGDLVDRGPDPVAVVRVARNFGAEAVLGNHEEKHVRWDRWEARVAAGKAPRNPMHPFDPQRLAEHNALSADDRAWLADLPPFIRFEAVGRRWLATHAGVAADKAVEAQALGDLVRTRYVDAAGAYASTGDPREIPEGAVPWYTRWPGPESVVYGHDVADLDMPRVTEYVGRGYGCYGLDTGCVFGGHLTALVLTEPDGMEFVQVRAPKVYYDRDPRAWKE